MCDSSTTVCVTNRSRTLVVPAPSQALVRSITDVSRAGGVAPSSKLGSPPVVSGSFIRRLKPVAATSKHTHCSLAVARSDTTREPTPAGCGSSVRPP